VLRLTYHVLVILAPQIVLLITVALLALCAKLNDGSPRSIPAMICFTGMVVASLAQLRLYAVESTSLGTATIWPGMVLDPMGWILSFVIFLIATVSVMTRRLRSYSGQGDLRYCLLVTISTLAWSIMPALHNLPLMAGCMMLGSLPLVSLSTFGSDRDWLGSLELLAALAVMLITLLLLVFGVGGIHLVNGLIIVPPKSSAAAAILVVLFLMPSLFWLGSLPLVWWFGDAAGREPAAVSFFVLLAPYIGSLAAYLRIVHRLNQINPAAAHMVTLTIMAAGAMAVLAYGIRAVLLNIVPDVLGNVIGVLAGCTLVTIAAGMSMPHVGISNLVGCGLLYALTAGIAMGSAAGIMGRQALGLKQQWPSFARVKAPQAFMLLLALISLGGLPPTLGSVARIGLMRVIGSNSPMSLFVLGFNVLGILLGSAAALRVGAYALMGDQEPIKSEAQPARAKRRKTRRMAVGGVLLLLTACVLNALALMAYNPIQQVVTAFAPAWTAR
jgi:NADH:ubiquinone oxidoreductase subunit 2 (subunit N)